MKWKYIDTFGKKERKTQIIKFTEQFKKQSYKYLVSYQFYIYKSMLKRSLLTNTNISKQIKRS